jgi:hypothetical protein
MFSPGWSLFNALCSTWPGPSSQMFCNTPYLVMSVSCSHLSVPLYRYLVRVSISSCQSPSWTDPLRSC